MKKRYHLELSRLEYSLLIFSFFLIGGLLFTLGMMVGYYQSRSSYEYIMQQTTAEGNMGDSEKVAVFEVNNKDTTSNKPPHTLAEKPTGKQLHPAKVYGVQVASFKKKVDADRLRNQLRKKNYKAFVSIADLGKKGIWYRVRVGKFRRRKTAENLARVITKREKLKALVIEQ